MADFLHQSVTKYDGNKPEHWKQQKCGHCGLQVSMAVIASYPAAPRHQTDTHWLLCPSCLRGSVSTDGILLPGTKLGPDLEGLPPEIEAAYNEARNCMAVSAYTACELMCRKLLMHIAVEKGADEGKKFAVYVDYLEKQGFITPPMKGWSDLIRQHGNDATHKIEPPSKDKAESTLMFTAELLRIIYEMPFIASKHTIPAAT